MVLEHEEGVEEFLLHAPDAEVHLRERSPEDQDNRQGEQHHRQLEGDEEVAELADDGIHAQRRRTVRRNSRNAGELSRAASLVSGPMSLKNQVSLPRGTTAPMMRVGASLAVPVKSTTSTCNKPMSKCSQLASSWPSARGGREIFAAPAVEVGEQAAGVAREGGDRQIGFGAAVLDGEAAPAHGIDRLGGPVRRGSPGEIVAAGGHRSIGHRVGAGASTSPGSLGAR